MAEAPGAPLPLHLASLPDVALIRVKHQIVCLYSDMSTASPCDVHIWMEFVLFCDLFLEMAKILVVSRVDFWGSLKPIYGICKVTDKRVVNGSVIDLSPWRVRRLYHEIIMTCLKFHFSPLSCCLHSNLSHWEVGWKFLPLLVNTHRAFRAAVRIDQGRGHFKYLLLLLYLDRLKGLSWCLEGLRCLWVSLQCDLMYVSQFFVNVLHKLPILILIWLCLL